MALLTLPPTSDSDEFVVLDNGTLIRKSTIIAVRVGTSGNTYHIEYGVGQHINFVDLTWEEFQRISNELSPWEPASRRKPVVD
jgi:hypothetical protein